MTFLSRTYARWLVLATAAASAGLTGCQGGSTTGPSPDDAQTDFISGNPRNPGGRDNSEGDDAGGSTGAGGGAGAPTADDGGDGGAERAITEADIIQVHDGKLYALSQYSGLSIIDISRRDRLRLVGRYEASGIPFEMYLRDGVVYAMFSSWGQYLYNEADGSYTFEQTSRIEALDVSDPANIASIGSFNLPGSISDSRIVGDVLYAVTFEDGYCWGCSGTRNTTVTSLAVGDPAEITVVDQLTYDDEDPYGYGWQRSVSVTADRMYVAGIEWNGTDEGHSTIQVIDISDPGGDLVEGTSVEAVGQIQSRWQMDEHEGVLRVISQPGLWWNNAAKPGVQTFTVASSQELTPLGYTELTLPRPESLRSVRFDGDRAYAITAEQTDPLFTIDLSDPENPAQLGELEMPGWVYHMEPRGDRVLALGFDNAAAEGALHVSLFDVSDLANPTMLERVHFGGDWGSFAEDQDRIHKAFTILDDLGALLVPFSGWEYDENGYGCGAYRSGIQLIDFTADTLTKRGVAPARGQARRAFVHDERLFAVSDQEVGTFSIDDRDAPVATADLALATVVSNAVTTGDLVVRMSADWWTNRAQLEVVSAADPTRAEPLGRLDLSTLTSESQGDCYGSGLAEARVFTHGQHAYLLWPTYTDWTKTNLAVIDLTNPAAPRIASQRELPFSSNALYAGGYYGAVLQAGDAVVQAGSTLVLRNANDTYYYYDDVYYEGSSGTGAPKPSEASLEIIDLSNPSSPAHRTVALPEGAGHTALLIDGTTVLTSHWVPLPDDPSRARFYLDRIDVADPSAPVVRTPVNVPGSLLAFDGASRRALTVDYETVEFAAADYAACYGVFAEARFEPTNQESWEGPGVCTGTRRTLKLLDVGDTTARLRDESSLPDNRRIAQVLAGDDRVFMYTAGNYIVADSDRESSTGILVASGLEAGSIDVATQPLEDLDYGWPILADDARLVIASYNPPSIAVLDAADLDELTYETKGELSSYTHRVTISGDRALCSLGHYGLEIVDLGD
ncbi:beta-propeller domain-containing protein [Sorangium sp. So ce406]|uniref:beta-propeller domain-containing protein n=1 Tax=Sorangium sp. So ce406 TaxID=3133311 RepID=UPI003F5C1A02